MIYLVLDGSERLLIEFIRLNLRLLFGLSEAQLISIVLILIGIVGLVYLRHESLRVRLKRDTPSSALFRKLCAAPSTTANEITNLNDKLERLYRTAFRLAIFTIVYNLAEGLVAIFFGQRDGSLTLFGFGVDSFIEVISGIGIAHMVLRIRRNPEGDKDKFEKTALRVTGVSFYVLVLGLLATSVHKLITGEKPETTLVGVILSLISIAVMIALMYSKISVGKTLNSEPIMADAQCTRVCVYMSIVLLVASALYELTKVAYVDILGSLALAYFSFKEGRESLEKAKDSESYVGEDT